MITRWSASSRRPAEEGHALGAGQGGEEEQEEEGVVEAGEKPKVGGWGH